MARTVRDSALVTRSARLRLAPGTKHWRMLEQGLHLGYRRRATGGTWIARRRNENGIYHEESLALAGRPRAKHSRLLAGAARRPTVREGRLYASAIRNLLSKTD
jgi:hypothetical protein